MSISRVSTILKNYPKHMGMLPQLVARTSNHLNPEHDHFHLVRDWQPGPYPETEEERLAAAKKYNLFPEEYEPYPLNPDGWGLGYGDYPKLPVIYLHDRNANYPWDYPDRRNFCTPIHVNGHLFDNALIASQYKEKPLTNKQALRNWIITMFCLYLYSIFDEKFRFFPPIKPQHLPARGDHYYYPKIKH